MHDLDIAAPAEFDGLHRTAELPAEKQLHLNPVPAQRLYPFLKEFQGSGGRMPGRQNR
jgi:hypothetical protein